MFCNATLHQSVARNLSFFFCNLYTAITVMLNFTPTLRAEELVLKYMILEYLVFWLRISTLLSSHLYGS